MKDKVAGQLLVGKGIETDADGNFRLVFSARQARALARLMYAKAREAEQ